MAHPSRSLAIVSTLVIASAAVLISCAPSTSTVSTHHPEPAEPTPTLQIPTATAVSTPVLGSIPTQCAVSTTSPQAKFSELGTVIGASPVWATWAPGPNKYHLVLPPPYPSTYEPPYGWEMGKVIWEVGPNYSSPVTIRGYDLADNTPLLLQADGAPVNPLILDPGQPDHPVSVLGSGWAEWGTYIVVPKAGCYRMVVAWPQGSWSVTFSAGA